MFTTNLQKSSTKIGLTFTLLLNFVLTGCPETSTEKSTTTAADPGVVIRPAPATSANKSIPDCTQDGQIGCKTTNAFRAVDMKALKPDVLKDGLTVAGVLGRLMTPADEKLRPATDRIAARGFLSLDNYANLSAAHPWVDVSTVQGNFTFHSYLFIAIIGANSSSQIVFKLQQAKDVLGSGNKDIPGKSFTHMDSATGQRLIMINLKYSDLDIANGYRYARLRTETTGGTTTQLTSVMLGVDSRLGSADTFNISEVLAVIQ